MMKTGLSVCLVLAAFAVSTPSQANHPWGTYHWAVATVPSDNQPAVLPTGDNLAYSWKGFLATTANGWNPADPSAIPVGPDMGSVSVEQRLVPAVVAGRAGMNCGAVRGTTQVCNKKYGSNGWLGLAQIWLSGSHIYQGVAKMNDTYFSMTRYNVYEEKLHVMCQEVAHTFGLGHQSTTGASLNTCMDYYNNKAGETQSTQPNQHDFGQLVDIYNHGDSSTTLSAMTLVSAQNIPNVLDRPADWGRLVSQSGNGRSSTYEKQYAGGIRILTHVTWTVEAASRCTSCDHRFEARE